MNFHRMILCTIAPAMGVAVALAAGGCAPDDPGTGAPDGRPNLVVISIDTLNPRDLPMFNPEASALPNLEAFAAESVRFRRAYSTASWTLPAHASLLTGLYPDRHGATDPRRRIAPEATTLAQVLEEAGYQTVGFTDAGYVDAEFGFGRGFAVYDDESSDRAVKTSRLPRGGKPNRQRGATLFDRALAFLEERKPGAPLFLFLHTYAVHDYFRLHPWIVDALPPFPRDESPDRYVKGIQGAGECTDEEWDRLVALYHEEIRHLDRALGPLLEGLRELPGETYIAFVSDHGEGFDPDRGRIHHGGRLHGDVLHVPWFLSGPGLEPRDVDAPVSLVDVVPTVLDLLEIAAPGDLDGRSRAGEGAPEAAPDATVFGMDHYYRWVEGRRVAVEETQPDPVVTAAITASHWLIAGQGNDELYSVDSDPDQADDLFGEAPESGALLEAIVQRLRPLPDTEAAAVDSALQEQLRSLGYLD
ncbi:MAG: sulfatase [Gemmatimonadetes bacterium]|nr:sulfatase [Gemmatimonadota bacterium]